MSSEELKLKGRIATIKAIENGVSKGGKDWSKRDFVIETEGEYRKLIAFTLLGDKTSYIDKFSVGSVVEVKFNIESREFNEKYFHNINAYSIIGEEISQNKPIESGLSTASGIMPNKETPFDENEGNDLPF